MRRIRWCAGAALACVVVACGASGAVQTALHGELSALKRDIQAEQRAGALDRGRVEELAAAVAGREVRSARGQSAVSRIRQVRSCAVPLLTVLEERADRPDDIGAEAALVLVELRRMNRASAFKRYVDADSGAWRAVAARAAVARDQAARRRALFHDPDERVRRAALQAALEAPESGDLEPLLEAARVDPDATSRSLATRGVGVIGGERAVLALVDLWPRADETTRLTLVEAWSSPRSYATGGRRELVRLAESARGLPAVAAAGALVRNGEQDAELGGALLARAIGEGTAEERTLAIRTAPVDDARVRQALEKTKADDDTVVRVAVLARLLTSATSSSASRSAALGGLRKLVSGKDAAALEARSALAEAGDTSVAKHLVGQLADRDPTRREHAAVGLMHLGDWSRAATALADDDPDVRARVACSMLALGSD
jgi:hypothetical protein